MPGPQIPASTHRTANLRQTKRAKWWQTLLVILVAVPFVPLLLAAVVMMLSFYVAFTICLHLVIWTWWCGRGRDVLFIYSDSPVWRDHVEQRMLPYLRHRAIVLNWSQRKCWPASLARTAFRHFGGHREFNPLAVVFRPLRPTRTFRFWKPFKEFKNGNPAPVQKLESDLFRFIGVIVSEPQD